MVFVNVNITCWAFESVYDIKIISKVSNMSLCRHERKRGKRLNKIKKGKRENSLFN